MIMRDLEREHLPGADLSIPDYDWNVPVGVPDLVEGCLERGPFGRARGV
jgi:hypothetical protein